jgi:hypothetical protein
VLVFRLQPGSSAHVEKRTDRLEVVFDRTNKTPAKSENDKWGTAAPPWDAASAGGNRQVTASPEPNPAGKSASAEASPGPREGSTEGPKGGAAAAGQDVTANGAPSQLSGPEISQASPAEQSGIPAIPSKPSAPHISPPPVVGPPTVLILVIAAILAIGAGFWSARHSKKMAQLKPTRKEARTAQIASSVVSSSKGSVLVSPAAESTTVRNPREVESQNHEAAPPPAGAIIEKRADPPEGAAFATLREEAPAHGPILVEQGAKAVVSSSLSDQGEEASIAGIEIPRVRRDDEGMSPDPGIENGFKEEQYRKIYAAFDDPTREARDAAALALFDLNGDPMGSFTRALREADSEKRRRIGASVASSGLASDAISRLSGGSSSEIFEAFSLLFMMAKAGEIEPLLRAIEEHPSNEVRLAVVKLLASSEHADTLSSLLRLSTNGSLPKPVRSAVMETIYRINGKS